MVYLWSVIITSIPPSCKMKGGIKLWFIDSTNKTLQTINSQTLVVSGQSYAMTASMIIGICIVPTSLINTDTVALIPNRDRICQYLPQTTMLACESKWVPSFLDDTDDSFDTIQILAWSRSSGCYKVGVQPSFCNSSSIKRTVRWPYSSSLSLLFFLDLFPRLRMKLLSTTTTSAIFSLRLSVSLEVSTSLLAPPTWAGVVEFTSNAVISPSLYRTWKSPLLLSFLFWQQRPLL